MHGAVGLTTSLSEHSAARRLIEHLVSNGICQFFGIPGGPAAPIFEAVRVTKGARLVDSRLESSAVFAAAAFYRATGQIAVVLTTSGPGIANAAGGIVAAHLEQTPVLIISGDVSWSSGRLLLQDSGAQGTAIEHLYAHAACRIERVHSPQSAVPQCLSALNAALAPRAPGPAIVILPLDIALREAPFQQGRLQRCKVEDEFAPADLRQAVELLSRSTSPLVLIGGACRPYATAIQELVDTFRLPFTTTPRAKGTLSENHPLSLRNAGLAASGWARSYTESGVDVCLALGTDLDDCSVGPTPFVGKQGALIHVDISAHVFHRNIPCALGITACVGAFCGALKEAWLQQLERFPLPQASAALERARRCSPLEQTDTELDATRLIHPARAVLELQAALPRPLRVVSDIGAHMLFAFHYLTIGTDDSFDIQFNPGSMGSGIAGAIGLSLSDVSRPVLCICGDGGMHMNGMEVLVAAKHQLPIVYAVFNDGRYNIVHHGMKQLFGEAEAWDMPPVDFSKWACALGVNGAVVDKPGQIRAELIERLTNGFVRPCVLDIRIDAEVILQGSGRVEALQQMGGGVRADGGACL